METIHCKRISEIKRERKFLEGILKTKLIIRGGLITINASPLEEYEADKILSAISTGFSARIAATLKDENVVFETLNIKDYSRTKNLKTVRSRLIGTRGKTKKTIEQITGSHIIIKDNTVAIICSTESIEYVITAISNIIKGSKQKNAYKYLERINSSKKNLRFEMSRTIR